MEFEFEFYFICILQRLQTKKYAPFHLAVNINNRSITSE